MLESSYVDTWPTTQHKALVFEQLVPCSFGFESMASDSRVNAPGGASGQNLWYYEYLRKRCFAYFFYIKTTSTLHTLYIFDMI